MLEPSVAPASPLPETQPRPVRHERDQPGKAGPRVAAAAPGPAAVSPSARREAEIPRRARILTFADYYLPGYKGGGSLRTLVNMVEQLSDSLDFRIVTRDRDLGDTEPYPGVIAGAWNRVGKAQVRYQGPGSAESLRAIIREVAPDVIYINSFFSPRFALAPLVASAAHREIPIVLAPRGEFSPGALMLKRWKKLPYLTVLRSSGLLRRVLWQTSAPQEEAELRRWVGKDARIWVAPDLCGSVPPVAGPPPAKERGELRVVFLSRISPKKNLDYVLHVLQGVRGRVLLTIHGPTAETVYWEQCRELIARLPSNVRAEYGGPVPHDEIPATLRRHHVFFFPTRGENFGHVVLEALLAGLPVVMSDRTPWDELRARGVGAEIPLEDAEAFRSVLEGYVDMSYEAYAAASARARAYGEERVRDPALIERNLGLFRSAMGITPSGGPEQVG